MASETRGLPIVCRAVGYQTFSSWPRGDSSHNSLSLPMSRQIQNSPVVVQLDLCKQCTETSRPGISLSRPTRRSTAGVANCRRRLHLHTSLPYIAPKGVRVYTSQLDS